MLKRVLVAAAILIATPAFVSAQLPAEDIFITFGQGASATTTDTVTTAAGTGSAFVFVNAGTGLPVISALDLDFVSSDPSVIEFTNATVFNSAVAGSTRFQPPTPGLVGGAVGTVTSTSTGSLAGLSVLGTIGINPNLSAVDADFDIPLNSFLFAQIDFDIVGTGTTSFDLSLGGGGVIEAPATQLDPSFGSAELTVNSVPEPSSAILLVLGGLGLVARRKRA